MFPTGEELILISRASKPSLVLKIFGSGSNDWRRMRWAEHVARIGKEERCIRVMVGILK